MIRRINCNSRVKMDLHKLTQNEIVESLTEVGTDIYELAAHNFKTIEPGKTYPIPIADLYIAQSLYKTGIHIPKGYDINKLPADVFVQLAQTYYLPNEDTPANRLRAERITRIILDLAHSQNDKPKIEILPVVFVGLRQSGDFSWMITRPEYADTLFIFNDNEQQFQAFAQYLTMGANKTLACGVGGGNATIRPYQCQNPPRAAGIPTGSSGLGYTNLITAKPQIDAAIKYIRDLLATGHYKRVAYSAANDGRTLGTAIFAPSPDIKEYIVKSIESLAV